MSSSTRTTAAQGKICVRTFSVRNLFCLITILLLAIVTASAQTIVAPNTTTVQFLGVPNPQGTTDAAVTAPLGGIILKGTALSPATGQPERHLWVADATSGICRVDPDLDSPGPYAMNLQTCPFKINGASITGGPMSFDPTPRFLDPANPTIATNYLYFADEQRASQGIMRIGYLATGDSGHGFLNFASVFVMGGNTTGARFGGGTTCCALPGNPGLPHATVLDPLGNLWVGFKKSGVIVRFNQPGDASETGFGTCDQFITPVATVDKISNGLGFIGHDLWGSDGTSPFFIKNADTTCMVPPHGTCTVASGDVINTLVAAVGAAPTAAMTDQYYPATNGNNVYFSLSPAGGPFNTAWLGNASAATAASMAATTLDTTFYGTFSPAGGPSPAIANINGLGVDPSDPANIVLYSADDYSGAGILAKGMWFQSCQGIPAVPAPAPAPSPYMLNCPTPVATAAPGTPLNVVGVASNNAVTVSWSPTQSNQPVTSYTVNTLIGGVAVGSTPVVPVAGSLFPPTSVLISGLTNFTTYTFTVSATNASGTSPDSAPSAPVTPPGIAVPAPPTGATAIPGDTQASVSFTVSPPPQGAPVTSYLVTSNPGGIVVSIPPPASGNIGTALVGGLTNGVSYTFTVQAIDSAGASAPSAPSNAVTPSAAHVPVLTVAISGPTSVSTTPSQVTYTISVTNPINATQAFPANVNVTHTLTQQPATIAASGASRNGVTGVVTITTASPHALSIGQSITVAGVTDASFNGTFTISDVPSATTLTYLQAGATATSGSGTVLGLPLANIVIAQTSQGTCTSGGTGVITITCNQGVLAAGASSTVTVIVQIQSQSVLNSVVASGTDAAGTLIPNANASITTTVPLPTVSNISTAVSVAGNAQVPNPNVGQAGNIVWTISNTSQVAAPNVVFTIFTPNGLTINAPNPPSVTVNNGGAGSCGAGTATTVNGVSGTLFTCTTPTLGGSTKNGAKPPQTMIITQNVTPAAGTSKAVFNVIGTVSFGPGGTDTLPSSKTVVITVR